MGLDGVCVSVSVCVCCAAPRVFPRSWDHPRAGVGAARRLSLACLSPVRSRVDPIYLVLACRPRSMYLLPRSTSGASSPCAVSDLRQQRQRRSVGRRWWWRRRLFGLAGWPAVWPRRVATHHRRLGLVPASWLGLPTLKWRRSSAAERDVRIFDGWHVVRPPSCLWLCAPIQCDLGDYEFFQDHVVLEARWQALVSW